MLMNRIAQIAGAFTEAKRTFLGQTDWQTIPWASDPSQKCPLHRLMDIWSCVPGLLEDLQNLQNPRPASASR